MASELLVFLIFPIRASSLLVFLFHLQQHQLPLHLIVGFSCIYLRLLPKFASNQIIKGVLRISSAFLCKQILIPAPHKPSLQSVRFLTRSMHQTYSFNLVCSSRIKPSFAQPKYACSFTIPLKFDPLAELLVNG
ncbi:hypothetical protein I3843_10G050900 [Carya illinoinensis]|nr:hypothetical protein I3760_10G050900 [Carya illinoinensis]KAG7959023.1 hypothetical protein I3843_10G050900 [Carya illinoinensis]